MIKRFRVPMIVGAATLLLAGAVTVPALAATAPTLQFSLIQFDSPGKDTRSAASLNAEYVRIVNKGRAAVSLGRYTLRDASGHVFTFPAHTVGAGKTVYVHTGKGTNGKNPAGKPDAPHLYWGSGNYVWNNDRDTATLRSATGRAYDTCSWTKTGTGSTKC